MSCTDHNGNFSVHTGAGVAQALTPHVRRVTYVSRASRRPNVGCRTCPAPTTMEILSPHRGRGRASADPPRTQGDVRESRESTPERGVQDLSCTDHNGKFSVHTGAGVAQALTPHVRRVTYVSRASRRPNVGCRTCPAPTTMGNSQSTPGSGSGSREPTAERRVTYVSRASRRPNVGCRTCPAPTALGTSGFPSESPPTSPPADRSVRPRRVSAAPGLALVRQASRASAA